MLSPVNRLKVSQRSGRPLRGEPTPCQKELLRTEDNGGILVELRDTKNQPTEMTPLPEPKQQEVL